MGYHAKFGLSESQAYKFVLGGIPNGEVDSVIVLARVNCHLKSNCNIGRCVSRHQELLRQYLNTCWSSRTSKDINRMQVC